MCFINPRWIHHLLYILLHSNHTMWHVFKCDTKLYPPCTVWIFHTVDREVICVELNSDKRVKLHEEIRTDSNAGDVVNEGQRMRSDFFKESLSWFQRDKLIFCFQALTSRGVQLHKRLSQGFWFLMIHCGSQTKKVHGDVKGEITDFGQVFSEETNSKRDATKSKQEHLMNDAKTTKESCKKYQR